MRGLGCVARDERSILTEVPTLGSRFWVSFPVHVYIEFLYFSGVFRKCDILIIFQLVSFDAKSVIKLTFWIVNSYCLQIQVRISIKGHFPIMTVVGF